MVVCKIHALLSALLLRHPPVTALAMGKRSRFRKNLPYLRDVTSSEPLCALIPAVLPGSKPFSASIGNIPAVFKTGTAFVEVFSLKQQLQNIHFAERVNTLRGKRCIFFDNIKNISLPPSQSGFSRPEGRFHSGIPPA